MLWLDMGLGKTSITLTSLVHLLNEGFLRGVIIVAPIRVIRLVWRQEATKWEHTKHLRFSMVTGTKDQRTRALMKPADVYLINYENIKWLAETLHTYFIKKDKQIPFNGIVWDEVSKCKNSNTNRVKAVRKILDHFDWSTGLTGTPASNGYKDLHGQFLVVDKGERLGTSKTAFKTRFYRKVGPYKEMAYEDTESTIKNLIGDITLEMSAADYNPLPDLVVNNIELELPDSLRAKYELMEKEFFLQLDSGTAVEVFNQASLTNKCLQFSNGAMYPIAGAPVWEAIHDLKLNALEDIIDEAQGSPVLCSYAYRSDAQRIMERFKKLEPINLTECKSETSLTNAMRRWKDNDCPLMIGHPACLHPETQVLTERYGWIRLIDVESNDRVFDGIEFVTHAGCSYSGYMDVITVLGITMTPDHKLLIGNQWVEARNVRDCEEIRREAVSLGIKTKERCTGSMPLVRGGIGDASAECHQEQQEDGTALSQVHREHVPSHDEHSILGSVERNKVQNLRCDGQKLWGSRYHNVSRMGRFQSVLRGYAQRLLRGINYREDRCEQTIPERQLPVGDKYGAAVQQTQQPGGDIQWRTDAFGRIGEAQRILQDDVDHATQSGDDSGPSSDGLRDVKVWEKSGTQEHYPQGKTHVYDLVNCGPRHQFVIRNSEGEVFISHNSMGHGIDGLQENGHILAWFGLNWSLDLYEQFNARVRRQGQGVPVICHRILIRKTLDQAQGLALDQKAQTQSGLRSALKEYRMSKGG